MSETLRSIEVPEGWVSVPLVECAEILDSRRIPLNSKERSARTEGKSQDQLYPYYGATGQVGFIDDFIFEGEHLLIGEDGAPFYDKSKNVTYIAKGKFWVNNHAHILKALEGVTSNKYLLHYLNKFNYKGYVGGTTRLKLNQANLKQIPVPLAPPEQQKRIVAKIEELFTHIDAGIEALKKAKQLLKQYRQSVLKAAVTGELTKEWREVKNLPAPKPGSFFTYVIKCDDDSNYIGHTQDLQKRWGKHCAGNGSEWTSKHKPKYVMYWEEFESREEAAEKEKWLKTGYGRKWIKREEKAGRMRQAGLEPASHLLERILKERRQKWEEQQLEQFKAKGKMPKDDKWKEKYKESVQVENIAELEGLPETWEWVCLDSLIVNGPQNGLYLPKTKYGSGVPIVRIDDFQDGYVRPYDELQKVNASKSESEIYSLQKGNLVVNRVNSPTHLGKCMVVKEGYDPCLFESNMMKAELSPYVCTDYIDYYIQSKFGRSKLIRNAKWAVNQASINQQDVRNTEITLPPFEEQTEITRLVSEKFDGIDRLNNELDVQLSKAEKNRQSILASAFSGKV